MEFGGPKTTKRPGRLISTFRHCDTSSLPSISRWYVASDTVLTQALELLSQARWALFCLLYPGLLNGASWFETSPAPANLISAHRAYVDGDAERMIHKLRLLLLDHSLENVIRENALGLL